VPTYGDGTTRRDCTYVGDIVEGIVRATDRCTGHHLYNLGHSDPVELRELIEAISRALGKAPRVERLPEQPGDVRQTYADVSRARAELGYEPSTPFDEGLRRFVACTAPSLPRPDRSLFLSRPAWRRGRRSTRGRPGPRTRPGAMKTT
jgi:UDP-glucuronate 4-epimerase